MTSTIEETARAKINLSLRVLGRRADGYHEIESLVAFAGTGDALALAPGPRLSLAVSGPFGGAIGADNLVTRGAGAVAERWPWALLGAFRLEKLLPVAAGLGGGSADAAAALRLLRRANPGLGNDGEWQAIAAGLGSDVPVCMLSRASFMSGRGEAVVPVPPLPPLAMLLVNPGMPLATAAVFRALEAPAMRPDALREPAHGGFASAADLVAYLAVRPNDLQPPASRLCPAIADVIAALEGQAGALLARLSGSGPTCFGIFADAASADLAGRVIKSSYPRWWVVSTGLS